MSDLFPDGGYGLSQTEPRNPRGQRWRLLPHCKALSVPFGKARIRRPGKDLTIITYGNTTHLCLNVAELLYKEKGWELEVIDLRTLIPLDKEAIFNSVKKTSKVLIVHEDKVFSGFGAEIAGIIGSELFQYLDAPIQRVGSLFTPVGFHPVLERAILPNEETIYHAAKELLLY